MGHYVSFHTYHKVVSQLISVVEDDASVVECVVGQWPYGDYTGGDRMKDFVL